MEKLILGSLNLRCSSSSVPVDFLSFSFALCGKLPVPFSCTKASSGNGQQQMGPSHHGQSLWGRALSVLMKGARCLEQCHLWHLSLRLMVCDVPNTDRHGQGIRKDCWGSWVIHHNPRGKARKTRLDSLFRMFLKHKTHNGNELWQLLMILGIYFAFLVRRKWRNFKMLWRKACMRLAKVRHWISLPGMMVGSSTGAWIILPSTGLAIIKGLTEVWFVLPLARNDWGGLLRTLPVLFFHASQLLFLSLLPSYSNDNPAPDCWP